MLTAPTHFEDQINITAKPDMVTLLIHISTQVRMVCTQFVVSWRTMSKACIVLFWLWAIKSSLIRVSYILMESFWAPW